MKKFITFFLTCISLSLFAQTFTFSDGGNCYSSCGLTKSSTNTVGGQIRNIFTNNCAGYVTRLIYDEIGVSSWKIQYYDPASGLWLLEFQNAVTTFPNPPNGTGGWVKVVGGSCNNLTSAVLGGVLPVELTQFDANTEGSKNNLTWRTASELNNKHFDIERSTDGTTFHSIGQVKGNNKPSTYQFVDHQPFATTYYRLRQIDNDGTETYSKIVSVELKGKGKGLAVYPNPVLSLLNVEVIARNEATEGSSFQILNLLGQQVLTGKTPPSGAGGLDVSALPQGSYILKVGAEQAKFLKQ
jgi:Secretion system C-terminal sorting domain